MEVEGQLDLFETKKEVSVSEMDAVVEEMASARALYDAAKAVSNEAHAVWKEKEFAAMALLKEAGKTRYEVEGVGKISLIEKLKVKMPSSPEQKAEFFQWLRSQGEDMANTYLTLNYNSLNSLYNLEFENAENKAEFKLPGINEPESTTELRFKKQ